MSPSERASPAELDEQGWATLAAAVAGLEAAWQKPAKPTLQDFVPDEQHPLRRAILAELVKVDQEFRLRRRDFRELETYLLEWPELSESETVRSLLEAECLTRAIHDNVPTRGKLRQRFPEIADDINLQSILAERAHERSQISNRDTIIFEQAQDDTSTVPAGILSPPERDDELGRLGPYRILDVLGVGGMGVVFLAEDERLDRKVAIKTLRANLSSSREFRQRFLREARAAARLNHDHIVPIHQVGEANGVPFLAMQLLDGETLEDRLGRERVVAIPEVLRIGSEIVDALRAAHQIGLVHRDVKPANVWLEKGTGRVKLLDFGLASLATERSEPGPESASVDSDHQDEHLTRRGERMGTPAYMAPEQTLGDAIDARSDLYSLGCVLYRMTVGQLPFAGADGLSGGLAATPIPPRKIDVQIPSSLDALICKLLARRPQDRPAAAEVAYQELQRITVQRAAGQKTHNLWVKTSWIAATLVIGVLVLAALVQLVLSVSDPAGISNSGSPLVQRGDTSPTPIDFGLTRHYAVGRGPFDVATGDLDGDRILDLVASNMLDDSVSVLIGNGDGSFSKAVQFATGVGPHTIAIGDFNEDQRLDIAVATLGGNSVTLLLGDGSGCFSDPTGFAVGLAPRGLATSDLDGDGHLDLVASNTRSNDLSVLFGNGNGTFSPAISYPVENSPVATAVADFNHDGFPDLASSNGGGDSISVLLGLGDHNFEPALHRRYGGAGPGMLAIADYDEDGSLDVALESFGTNDVTVLLGNGDGTFRQGEVYQAGLGPGGIETCDFNGDGHVDLIVANHNSHDLSLFLGHGDGRFQPASHYLVGDMPAGVAIGDFDQDQRVDFAVANHWSDNLSVRLNELIRAHFSVQKPNQVMTLALRYKVRVTARDAAGNLMPDFLGTVHFASDDPRAHLPETYSFRAYA